MYSSPEQTRVGGTPKLNEGRCRYGLDTIKFATHPSLAHFGNKCLLQGLFEEVWKLVYGLLFKLILAHLILGIKCAFVLEVSKLCSFNTHVIEADLQQLHPLIWRYMFASQF